MSTPTSRSEEWRVGEHYAIHVYETERPVATFHDAADARRAVDAVNCLAAPVTSTGERRSLEDIERWWGESERDITALVAEVRRARAVAVDWLNRYEAAVRHERAVVAERDALRAAIQAAEALHQNSTRTGINVCVHCHKAWPCPTVAALAAAGVDREDTEQPQRDDAAHGMRTSEHWDEQLLENDSWLGDTLTEPVGDTGQADEPQPPCGDNRPHGAHWMDALRFRRCGGWAGQVVPQQPTDETKCRICGSSLTSARSALGLTLCSGECYRLDALLAKIAKGLREGTHMTAANLAFDELCDLLAARPGPVGQDTTKEQQ